MYDTAGTDQSVTSLTEGNNIKTKYWAKDGTKYCLLYQSLWIKINILKQINILKRHLALSLKEIKQKKSHQRQLILIYILRFWAKYQNCQVFHLAMLVKCKVISKMTQGAENKNENRTKYKALSKRDLHPF